MQCISNVWLLDHVVKKAYKCECCEPYTINTSPLSRISSCMSVAAVGGGGGATFCCLLNCSFSVLSS